MQFCTECATKLEDQVAFCHECGSQTGNGTASIPSNNAAPLVITTAIQNPANGANGVDDVKDGAGEGVFGDGINTPVYEFRASRFKSGRVFSPNIIRIWKNRVEEYEHHAIKKKGTRAINWHQVSQVNLAKGMVWSNISIESSGSQSINMLGVPNRDAQRVKEILDASVQYARSGGATAVAAVAAPRIDVADQLVKLVQLKDAGVLTDAEFDAQKFKLLNL